MHKKYFGSDKTSPNTPHILFVCLAQRKKPLISGEILHNPATVNVIPLSSHTIHCLCILAHDT